MNIIKNQRFGIEDKQRPNHAISLILYWAFGPIKAPPYFLYVFLNYESYV